MKTLNTILLAFTVFAVTGCDFSPKAVIGESNDESEYSGFPCDQFSVDTKEGSGTCAEPRSAATIRTEGDNGDLKIYFRRLSDDNFPVVQSLKFEAREPSSVGGGFESVYDIVFNCTAESETPDHLRPFHCVPQAAPRLRSKAQEGGGKVRFKEMVAENPSCHTLATYRMYETTCYPGNMSSVILETPTLGLVRP